MVGVTLHATVQYISSQVCFMQAMHIGHCGVMHFSFLRFFSNVDLCGGLVTLYTF